MRSRTLSEGREADSRSSCRSQAPRFPHGPEGPRRPEGLGKNRRVPVLQRKPQGPAASAYAGRMDGEVRKGRRCHEHRVRIEDARASRGAHALPGHAERERRAAGGGHRRQPVGAGGGHPLLRRQRHPALPHRLGRHPFRVEPGEPPGLGACVRGAARGHRGAGRPEPGAAQHAPGAVHGAELPGRRCRASGRGGSGLPRGLPRCAGHRRRGQGRPARGRRLRRQGGRPETLRRALPRIGRGHAPAAGRGERRPPVHGRGRAGGERGLRHPDGARRAPPPAEPRSGRPGRARAPRCGGAHVGAAGRSAEGALRPAGAR